MIIYFTRHGETLWNKKGILQGQKDSSLTVKGRNSAKGKGKILQTDGIDIIYSSDLGRCMQTAKIINKYLEKRLVKTPQLRERDFGDLNGQPNKEVESRLNLHNFNEKAPHGESDNDLNKRVNLFIQKLPKKKFKKVLLVIHEGVARVILSKYYRIDFSSKKCDTLNSAVYRLEMVGSKIKNNSLSEFYGGGE